MIKSPATRSESFVSGTAVSGAAASGTAAIRPRRRRKSLIGIAALAFLVMSLDSTPSVPSVPDPLEMANAPTPEEILALEELAGWLLGGPESSGLEAMSPRDLRTVIREKPRTFELFRSYNREEERLEYVHNLPFGEQIADAAGSQDLDPLLVAALVGAESSFIPRAVSPQGAIGLMQVMPSTGRLFGADDLGNPSINLEIGCRYLRSLLDDFDSNLEMALAAYNAGPTAVARYGGVPPYPETRTYVARVISSYVDHHHRVWETSGSRELFELR